MFLVLLSRLPLPRTKTVLLDRSLDRKGREKHLLHFVAVMKVHIMSLSTYVYTSMYIYVYTQFVVKTIIIVIMVCVCVYICVVRM